MLAVNISFLAVPFVQAQTSAILVSYLCATGSLVVTLVFARQVNDNQRYPHRCSTPLIMLVRSSERLECLFLMLSLPFAFSIWGMILLATTLSIVIFRTSDIATVPIAIPIWAAIIILATWPASADHIRCLLRKIKVQILIQSHFYHTRSSGLV
ncbi:hypothetical protein DFJ58DRAFT_183950 [Suillus subalutaceus]|uniref:uncharacterized protein n=1 Tax=Suillus subalutaceus TaxID=48586 RepID=UPI001B87CAF0|nr:uncharacterized protein DFJ58DRAFT_183950 [Suillus subalutaceus]KAG1876682.1 hypothetical protein DFJ58DRAFT_183950 [Suillus subalutaceus]